MAIFILFVITIPLCVWGFWVSQRGKTKNDHHEDQDQARQLLNDKQQGKAQESLTAIALNLGVTESAAAQIAINRLYLQLFHGGEEYDFPTAEQLKEIDAKFGTVNIVKSQTLAELLEGKAI